MSESHTSTHEWREFESRMRRRRAEQCLLRASAALDADWPEAAERALAEAHELCPAHPQLAEVAARLHASSSDPTPHAPNRSVMWLAFVVGWLLTAMALVH